MEVAIESGNEDIIDWFMHYINTISPCQNSVTNVDCFRVYCKIGEAMKHKFRKDWLDYDNFEEYIEGIIENGVNSYASMSGSYFWGYHIPVFNDDSMIENAFKIRGDLEGWRHVGRFIKNLSDVKDWEKDLCINGENNLTTEEYIFEHYSPYDLSNSLGISEDL